MDQTALKIQDLPEIPKSLLLQVILDLQAVPENQDCLDSLGFQMNPVYPGHLYHLPALKIQLYLYCQDFQMSQQDRHLLVGLPAHLLQ